MKPAQPLILFCAGVLFLSPVMAANNTNHVISAWPHSDYQSNVCIVFAPTSSTGGRAVARYGDMFFSHSNIVYGFHSSSTVFSVCVLAPEYGFEVWATDIYGKPIEKTRLGSEYGAKLHRVVDYDRAMLTKKGQGRVPYATLALPDFPSMSFNLPPLEKLFRFPTPGEYRVYIRGQVATHPFKPGPAKPLVIRFSPVELKVLHLER